MLIQPLLSIGIPTYNRPHGLDKVLNYLINQKYRNVEIIISDNSSSNPDVKSILENYASKDKRIKYYIQTANIEIEPNFNFVYDKCSGEYFMWMSDDDFFSENYLIQCVSFLEQNNEYALCAGMSFYHNLNGDIIKEKPVSLESKWPPIRLLLYFLKVNKNGVFYGIYRTKNKFFSPIGKHIGADWCHVARVSLLGKIKTLESCECHRSNDGGSSSRKKIVKRWNATGLKKVFIETYIGYQISSNLFNNNIFKNHYSIITQAILKVLIFLLLNIKFFWNSIYNRLIKSNYFSMSIRKNSSQSNF